MHRRPHTFHNGSSLRCTYMGTHMRILYVLRAHIYLRNARQKMCCWRLVQRAHNIANVLKRIKTYCVPFALNVYYYISNRILCRIMRLHGHWTHMTVLPFCVRPNAKFDLLHKNSDYYKNHIKNLSIGLNIIFMHCYAYL